MNDKKGNMVNVGKIICEGCHTPLILNKEQQKEMFDKEVIFVDCQYCGLQNKLELPKLQKQGIVDKFLNFVDKQQDKKRQDKIDREKWIVDEQRRKEEERRRLEEERKRLEEEEKNRLAEIERIKEEKRQRRNAWWKKYWWVVVLIVVFCLIYSLIAEALGLTEEV